MNRTRIKGHKHAAKSADSVVQSVRECFITGDKNGLHKHHIFQGCRRKASDEWGCWVWLRWDWHNGSNYCVHKNPAFDADLKRVCQEKFEALYGHEKFMKVFGKNYLEDI